MSNPFRNNILMTSFNNPKNILQDMRINTRMVICQETFSSSSYPNFSGIGSRYTFRYMSMYRFQRNTFVGPEINPERSYLKDLRHC